MEPIFFELLVDQETKRFCLVDLPTRQSSGDVELIANRLATRYANNLEQIDLLILRPDVGELIDNANGHVDRGKTVASFARRVPWAAIHMLDAPDFQHQLSNNLSVHHATGRYAAKIRDSIIEGIREREFEHYARDSDALLSAREGFVYRAPSGHYVRQFLRAGNIQKSRQALDATFFWMIPFLKDRSTIIADTWSISSIAINAARRLGKYQGGIDCKVDFLPEYFDGSRSSRHRAESILRYVDRGKTSILMLFSAVRSGRSLRCLQEAFSKILPAAHIKYLAIYSLGGGIGNDVPIDALCARLKGFEDVKKAGSVVRIDSSSFFPMTARDKPLKIQTANAKDNRVFFRYYKGIDAVRIHRNVYD